MAKELTMSQETNNQLKNGLILGQNNGLEYVLFKSTKEEVEQLIRILKSKQEKQFDPMLCDTVKYPFLDNIDYLGHVNDVFDTHCKDFIPIEFKRKEPNRTLDSDEKPTYTDSYKCYASKIHPKDSAIILHENAASAFRCASQTINAEYFYVLKLEINEPIPNNNRDTEVYKESENVGETKTDLL